jgi:ferredoxin
MDRLSLLDTTLRAFDSSLPDVVQSRCVATRYRSSTCRHCIEVCPVDAIGLPPLAVDPDRCVACGACAAACLTGALDYARPRSLVHERLADTAGGQVTIACSQADLDDAGIVADVTVACLAGLSGADLIAAAAGGCGRLVLTSGDCSNCPAGSAVLTARPTNEQVAAWLSTVGVLLRLEKMTTASTDAPMHPPAASVSRRDLFGLLLGRGKVVAAAAVASQKPTIQDLHAVTPPPAVQRRLLDDLESLRSRVTAPHPLPRSVPTASVIIGEACDGCGLCTRYCPHGALALTDGQVTINARRCTGCGLCAECCPREVVAVQPALVPGLATCCSSP